MDCVSRPVGSLAEGEVGNSVYNLNVQLQASHNTGFSNENKDALTGFPSLTIVGSLGSQNLSVERPDRPAHRPCVRPARNLYLFLRIAYSYVYIIDDH